MDSKEQSKTLKKNEGTFLENLQAEYANYLKAKYFSDKDIYGGNIFEEKVINGMTIKVSSEAGTKSYDDPVSYWNEKYANKEPQPEKST